jgi:protein TonB
VAPETQAAKLLRKVDPVYPTVARASNVQGDVTLRVRLSRDGRVLRVEGGDDSDSTLRQAAMDAVRQWIYRPTFVRGEAAEVRTTVTVPFRLDASGTPTP